MGSERRYQDHEVRQILDLAIGQDEASPELPSEIDGVTLGDLQEAAREIGLSPDAIGQAVAAFEGRGEPVQRGTMLGLPTTLGRTVALARSPSDREWELLVAELRTTFGRKGELTSHGDLREWSDGFMHAFVEPTEAGHRLRLTDSREAAMAGLAAGGLLIAFAVLIFVVLLGKDDPGFRFAVPVFFSLLGGGLIAATVTALPRWAREQERRMEHVCTRAASLLALPPSSHD
jgi:hypothetical protein